MQISSINNNTPSFGHSIRVSLFLKEANGNIKFVNPSKEQKLYRQLNSKIVNWLNEDHYTSLRNLYGKARKTQRIAPQTDKHKELVSELKQIDSDYARLSIVRSIYRRHQLGFIATGTDVPIIENIKGAKNIGLAKSDSIWNNGDTHSEYIKDLCKAVKYNILDYVEHDNVLLRSPRNKEIMLNATFKEAGKNKAGKKIFELDNYEFHENKTKPTLKPVNRNFINYKNSSDMMKEIKRTIEFHINKILKRKVHFNNIDKILNPQTEQIPQKITTTAANAVKTIEKKTKPKQQTLRTKQPVQLELKFED